MQPDVVCSLRPAGAAEAQQQVPGVPRARGADAAHLAPGQEQGGPGWGLGGSRCRGLWGCCCGKLKARFGMMMAGCRRGFPPTLLLRRAETGACMMLRHALCARAHPLRVLRGPGCGGCEAQVWMRLRHALWACRASWLFEELCRGCLRSVCHGTASCRVLGGGGLVQVHIVASGTVVSMRVSAVVEVSPCCSRLHIYLVSIAVGGHFAACVRTVWALSTFAPSKRDREWGASITSKGKLHVVPIELACLAYVALACYLSQTNMLGHVVGFRSELSALLCVSASR